MIENTWISDFDRYLIAEGTHGRAYEKLGAHLAEQDGQRGVHFAVWAPNAERASVIGDFNNWQPDAAPMQRAGESGIWTCFVAGLGPGVLYKYRLATPLGVTEKADPYAFGSEMRPKTASVVVDLGAYEWDDAAWMRERAERQALDAPLAIYEVHLGSWRRVAQEGNRQLSYR